MSVVPRREQAVSLAELYDSEHASGEMLVEFLHNKSFSELDMDMDVDVGGGANKSSEFDVASMSDIYNHPSHHQQQQQHQDLFLAKKETKVVRALKIVLVLILLLSSTSVAAAVYLYMSHVEQVQFESAFVDYATLIQDTVQTNAQYRLEAIGSLAKHVQIHVATTDDTWPYVTVPYFEEQVTVMKSLTLAYGIQLFPIVNDSSRHAWEEYSVQHGHYWMKQSYHTQESYQQGSSDIVLKIPSNTTWFDTLWGPDYHNPHEANFTHGMSQDIFRLRYPGNDTLIGPFVDFAEPYYFPQWQVAPMSFYYQMTVNSDYGQYDDFYNSTMISMETKTAVLGIAWIDQNAPGYITTMLYPIMDTLDGNHNTNDNDNNDDDDDDIGRQDQNSKDSKKVVAFLGADIYWRDYLTNILPENAQGIYVVITNTIDQQFTYQLFGENVTYLGEGDLHESINNNKKKKKHPDDEEMKQIFLFGSQLHHASSSSSSSTSSSSTSTLNTTYTGPPLYYGFVDYTFSIYPSIELQQEYISNKPILYTIGACVIFLFTSAIFILYDVIVERRQQIVMTSAIQSDAIVSSLFPSNVKEQLYNNNNNNNNNNTKRTNNNNNNITKNNNNPGGDGEYGGGGGSGMECFPHGNTTSTTIMNTNNTNATVENERSLSSSNGHYHHQHPISSSTSTSRFNNNNHNQHGNKYQNALHNKNGPPIAELYEDATVFFADIVGFTAWSSGRPPADVFVLLETLYGAFDDIAKKRGVFKVETIGDCYVAVTGVPHPRDDHAIVMAKFGRDMIETMKQQLHLLQPQLGSETEHLAIRVGLHSGPVTAGVLRGERARFQLFGDTMNTAARMESSSTRNRIHCSEATALLLKQYGKESWLTMREEKINPKGKGEMQTYWVDPSSSSTISVSSSLSRVNTSTSNRDLFATSSNTSDTQQQHTTPKYSAIYTINETAKNEIMTTPATNKNETAPVIIINNNNNNIQNKNNNNNNNKNGTTLDTNDITPVMDQNENKLVIPETEYTMVINDIAEA